MKPKKTDNVERNSRRVTGTGEPVLDVKITELESARQAIEERLRTETLVSEVSAGFLNLPAERVDDEIERRLGQIGEFLGLDRASLMEYHEGDPHMTVTHTWSGAGIPRLPERIPTGVVPWGFERSLRGEIVSFSSLDDIPPEASEDREFFRSTGQRSVAVIPLAIAGIKLGLATFVTLTHERDWSEDLLPRLRLIGEIFASALLRKRAEEALSRSESRYREMIDDHEDFIVRWTPDTRRTFVNDAYCRAFGQSREELLGTSFLPLIPDDSHRFVIEQLQRMTADHPAETHEHRVIRPDGSVGWQSWTNRGIFDEHGSLIEVQSVGRDITERRLADEALRVSEQRYRILVENAPEAIVVFDVDAERFTDVNENAVRLFKLERERLLQASPTQLSPPTQPNGRPSAEAARRVLGLALAGETPIFEWLHRDADGRDIPTEIRLVRQPAAEGKRLVRGSITDITERKRLQQELNQAQKMEAVGRLAGGIAHDFNNLLTAIQGNAELALSGYGPSNPCKAELHEIQAAAERAGALTRQLLAFSRKQRVQSRVLSANELIDDLGKLLRRIIGEDIRLVTRTEAAGHHVLADPGQLEQVIVNLAVNARDAMPRGGTLTIATRDLRLQAGRLDGEQLLEPGQYVVIEVCDTGVGIPRELQSRIFEPFFTTKERGKGTGLGLSTAYGVVAQNRGTIRVKSEPNRGSTFEICLPCSDARPDHDESRSERVVHGTETILLVEDEEIVRNLVRRGLTNYGYSVLGAASGEEALRLCDLSPEKIDMLITDVIMPGMSGVALAERIRSRREDIEVLFVSGYTDDLIQDHGASGSKEALLEKPFTPEDLAHRVRELLDRGPAVRRSE